MGKHTARYVARQDRGMWQIYDRQQHKFVGKRHPFFLALSDAKKKAKKK